MIEHKDFNMLLSDKQLEDIWGGANSVSGCCVLERQFPLMEKCCIKSVLISGNVYVDICQNCSLWKSIPQGADLKVTYIFECSLYRYCKRIKE